MVEKIKDELLFSIGDNEDNEVDEMIIEDFDYNIRRLVNAYEKRYKTKVIGIGLIGKLGRWNGTFDVGKIVRPTGSSVLGGFGSDCNSFEIYRGVDKSLYAIGYHHDGKIVLRLYFVTESKADVLNLSIGHINPDRLDAVKSKLSTIKYK